MILSENTMPYSRVFISVDQAQVGLVDFVKDAQAQVQQEINQDSIQIPPGYYLSWSGQFESEMESRKRLVPSMILAISIILILLYMAFKDFKVVSILAATLPISLMGGIILLFILDYRFSTAVWVGFIALFGVATDNAVVLLSTLEQLFKEKIPRTVDDIRQTVIEGGLMRVRPAMMTTVTTIIALFPIMFSSGTGSEIMKPMAAPTVGGLITATLANLILVPVLYSWIKERELKKESAK